MDETDSVPAVPHDRNETETINPTTNKTKSCGNRRTYTMNTMTPTPTRYKNPSLGTCSRLFVFLSHLDRYDIMLIDIIYF